MARRKSLVFLAFALVLAAPAAGDDGRGEQLYDLCAQCHGAAGGGDPRALAPPIAGLSEWYVREQLLKFRGGIRGVHPEDIGGLRMYPMALYLDDDGDLGSVASYVAGLPPADPAPTLEGADPARGKLLYTPCIACHGAEAEGRRELGGPNLRASADWYLLKQLHNFRDGIRGANPRDAAGLRMRPMSMTLVDEQAMKDVVAYILTLRP